MTAMSQNRVPIEAAQFGVGGEADGSEFAHGSLGKVWANNGSMERHQRGRMKRPAVAPAGAHEGAGKLVHMEMVGPFDPPFAG